MERQHFKASVLHISSMHGAPEGHHTPTMLWTKDDRATCMREPSPLRSRYVRNHNAHPAQGARHPEPDQVNRDWLHYGDSDPDNHGDNESCAEENHNWLGDSKRFFNDAFKKEVPLEDVPCHWPSLELHIAFS